MSLPVCLKCNTTMGSFASFCNQCGSKLHLPAESEHEPEKFYFCDSDGHRAQVHYAKAAFCAGCGKNIAPLPN